MTDASKSLDDLRAKIDRCDDAIHDLLMERASLVGQLTSAKVATPMLRPAREMEILRRLAARHDGPFPFDVVLHIWREIMAASLGLQTPFSVYVTGNDQDLHQWDLARFHFGTKTPFHRVATADHVVQEVAEAPNVIGIVPEFTFEDDLPWWRLLVGTGASGPRIAARLPLIEAKDDNGAFLIAAAPQRPTGDDVTLIAGLGEASLGRASLAKHVADAGLEAHLVSVFTDRNGGRRYFMLQADTYVAEDDARLAEVAQADGIFQLQVIGGYARPIQLGSAA